MLQIRQTLSRRRNDHSKSFARRPGVESLEERSLMATGFPVGFIGPLPSDGYYDPTLITLPAVTRLGGPESASGGAAQAIQSGTIRPMTRRPPTRSVRSGRPRPLRSARTWRRAMK